MRHKAINQRRLAYARITTQQCNLTFEFGTQGLYPIACLSTDSMTLIAYSLVELNHHLLIMGFLIAEYVALIKYKYYGHAVSLSGS